MEDPGELRRLAGFDTERHDILDLEVDGVTDPNRVAKAVLVDLDGCSLDAEVLCY